MPFRLLWGTAVASTPSATLVGEHVYVPQPSAFVSGAFHCGEMDMPIFLFEPDDTEPQLSDGFDPQFDTLSQDFDILTDMMLDHLSPEDLRARVEVAIERHARAEH